jgi:hypothetical protein
MDENTGLIFASSVDTDVVLAVHETKNGRLLRFVTVSAATKRGLRYHFVIPDASGDKLPLALDDGDGIYLTQGPGSLLASASAIPSDQPVYIHREAGNVVILKTMGGTVLGRDGNGNVRLSLDTGAKLFENGSARYSLGPIRDGSDEDSKTDGDGTNTDAPKTPSSARLVLSVTMMLVGVLGLRFLFERSKMQARAVPNVIEWEVHPSFKYRYRHR